MRGNLLVTVLMCLVAEAVFLYFTIENYYDGVQRSMTTRASMILIQLDAATGQSVENRSRFLRCKVEQFPEKRKI